MSESHAVPSATGVKTHPVSGSHEPTWHGFADAHVGGAFGVHVPAPLQVGAVWHRLPTEPHGVPSGAADVTQPSTGSHAAMMQALSEAHVRGVPG